MKSINTRTPRQRIKMITPRPPICTTNHLLGVSHFPHFSLPFADDRLSYTLLSFSRARLYDFVSFLYFSTANSFQIFYIILLFRENVCITM
jgi:hypothetical protein